MLKILIVITTGFESSGGLATVMLNYYRAMEKNDILIDFASTNEVEENLLNELKENNSCYYCIGNRKIGIIKYCINLFRIIKNNKYDVIHVNGNSSTMLIELGLAKLLGIKKRIAHCHTSKSNYPMLNRLLHPFFKKTYTHAVAVSKKSGDWLYGSDYTVLNNAINVEKYSFCYKERENFRKMYGINSDELLLGNVGKLNRPKNHSFLLDVFAEHFASHSKSKLLIVGGGELEAELRKKAHVLGVEKNVIFTGMVEDTTNYLQMMDIFLFPSIFEGLGMALIEAQAAGLPCISSISVPKESDVTNTVIFVDLDKHSWVEAIDNIVYSNRGMQSDNNVKMISSNGYNIEQEAYKLKRLYRS